LRLGTPRAVSSTLGKENPSQVDGRPPYEWRGIKNWQPGDPRFAVRETLRPGPSTDSPSNTAKAKAERLALFAAALARGADVLEAGAEAGVRARTARRYEQQLKTQRGKTP